MQHDETVMDSLRRDLTCLGRSGFVGDGDGDLK